MAGWQKIVRGTGLSLAGMVTAGKLLELVPKHTAQPALEVGHLNHKINAVGAEHLG